MANLPRFLLPERETKFDYSCERSAYIRINPSNGNQQANLNNGSELVFAYDGTNKFYRLADPESGFIIRASFRTKLNTANNHEANITLANNWPAHLFNQISFQLGTTILEQYSDVGTVYDILSHLKPREFRIAGGEASGFIPDSNISQAIQSLIAGDVPDIAAPGDATAADIAASANTAAENARNIVNLALNGNEGFSRRMKLYNNYTVGNDDFRTVECFIPLSYFFGCCEVDKVLKGINFEIKLTRNTADNFADMFLGSANTSVDFSNETGGGLQSIILQLVEYIPNPSLVPKIDETLAKEKISWSYKRRKVVKRMTAAIDESIQESTGTVPQFLFLVAKGNTGAASQQGAVTNNFSIFRHARIQSVIADLDGTLYPSIEQNADFRRNCYSQFYEQFARACMTLEGDVSAISAREYRDLYPIIAINCSNKPMKAKNSTSNLSVRIKRKDLPENNNIATDPLNVTFYLVGLYEESYEIDCTTKMVTKI